MAQSLRFPCWTTQRHACMHAQEAACPPFVCHQRAAPTLTPCGPAHCTAPTLTPCIYMQACITALPPSDRWNDHVLAYLRGMGVEQHRSLMRSAISKIHGCLSDTIRAAAAAAASSPSEPSPWFDGGSSGHYRSRSCRSAAAEGPATGPLLLACFSMVAHPSYQQLLQVGNYGMTVYR